MAKSIVQTPLGLQQALCHDPGQIVPVSDYPLSKEYFPNAQSELPLRQLHSLSLCSIAGHLKEISSSLPPPPHEEAVDPNEVFLSPLQTEQNK